MAVVMAASSLTTLALSFNDLPPFDWTMAIQVGIGVTIGALVVVGLAIATPGVAMVAAGSMVATVVSIGAVATVVGVIGGGLAGYKWGQYGEIQRQQNIQQVASVSRQLQIRFVPSAGQPDRAADFECTIVVYNEVDIDANPPQVDENHLHLSSSGSEEFYSLVQQKLDVWFQTPVLADRDNSDRVITIFMQPYPGDGVYERMVDLVHRSAGKMPHQTRRVDGPWRAES